MNGVANPFRPRNKKPPGKPGGCNQDASTTLLMQRGDGNFGKVGSIGFCMQMFMVNI